MAGFLRYSEGYAFWIIKPYKKIPLHVLIAEKAMGRAMPAGGHVHHINGNPSDNRNENLVVCPTSQYHHLLHLRERALIACGNANWHRCCVCKKYDAPENLVLYIVKTRNSRLWGHRDCYRQKERSRNRKARKRKAEK